jgi:Acetyltransferase (GNAT) domain
MENIQYLLHYQIDKKKWDECINRSVNRLIYAKSFYLDAMAANWDGIVLNDYEAVMPLTWKKKWGITYLYQPAFIQQGGIFFTCQLSADVIKAFIGRAFSAFKFAEITFNYLNDLSSLKGLQVSHRNNYVLPLTKSYLEIHAGYPASITKNLKRAKSFGLEYRQDDNYNRILKLYENLYAKRLPYFSSNDFSNFASVCKILWQQNNLVVRKVANTKNELLAAVVLLKDNNRLYNIISCVTKDGRDAEANYFLYDSVIQEFCNTDYTLDFEGSDIKGIADFYSRFKAINQTYPFAKVNNLNPIIKLLKR